MNKYKIKNSLWELVKDDLTERIKEYASGNIDSEYIDRNKELIQVIIRAILEIGLEILHENNGRIYVVDPSSGILPVIFDNILEPKP